MNKSLFFIFILFSPQFKALEVQECQNLDVSKLRQLGFGAQGVVYEFPQEDSTNQNRVVKSMNVSKPIQQDDKKLLDEFLNEAEILKGINETDVNEVVIQIYGICKIEEQSKTTYFMTLERCQTEMVDMMNQFQQLQKVTYKLAAQLMIQLLKMTLKINKENYYHIDNHINNFMFCNKKIKFIDFGKGQNLNKGVSSRKQFIYTSAEIRNLAQTLQMIYTTFQMQNDQIQQSINDMTQKMRDYPDLRNLLRDTMVQIEQIYKAIPQDQQQIKQNLNKKNEVIVFAENNFI